MLFTPNIQINVAKYINKKKCINLNITTLRLSHFPFSYSKKGYEYSDIHDKIVTIIVTNNKYK
jgi:hypothetical protein